MIANSPHLFSVYSAEKLREQCEAILGPMHNKKHDGKTVDRRRVALFVDHKKCAVGALEMEEFERTAKKLDDQFKVPRIGSHTSNLASYYKTNDGEYYKIVFHQWSSARTPSTDTEKDFRSSLVMAMMLDQHHIKAECVYAVATPLRGNEEVDKWLEKCINMCAGPNCYARGVLTKCAWCRATYYCSETCQRNHWREKHRKACSRAFKSKPVPISQTQVD